MACLDLENVGPTMHQRRVMYHSMMQRRCTIILPFFLNHQLELRTYILIKGETQKDIQQGSVFTPNPSTDEEFSSTGAYGVRQRTKSKEIKVSPTQDFQTKDHETSPQPRHKKTRKHIFQSPRARHKQSLNPR